MSMLFNGPVRDLQCCGVINAVADFMVSAMAMLFNGPVRDLQCCDVISGRGVEAEGMPERHVVGSHTRPAFNPNTIVPKSLLEKGNLLLTEHCTSLMVIDCVVGC
jgi:hypothetical protein